MINQKRKIPKLEIVVLKIKTFVNRKASYIIERKMIIFALLFFTEYSFYYII